MLNLCLHRIILELKVFIALVAKLVFSFFSFLIQDLWSYFHYLGFVNKQGLGIENFVFSLNFASS
jgi:hypothetical protein